MNENDWYVVDLYFKEYYGPYTSIRKANELVKILDKVSNLCVQVGTNVLVVNCLTFINDYRHYNEGSIDVVLERIEKMKGKQDAIYKNGK